MLVPTSCVNSKAFSYSYIYIYIYLIFTRIRSSFYSYVLFYFRRIILSNMSVEEALKDENGVCFSATVNGEITLEADIFNRPRRVCNYVRITGIKTSSHTHLVDGREQVRRRKGKPYLHDFLSRVRPTPVVSRRIVQLSK